MYRNQLVLSLLLLIACGDDSSVSDGGPPLDGSVDGGVDGAVDAPFNDASADAQADAIEPDSGPRPCTDDVCFEWLPPGDDVTYEGCNVGQPYAERCPAGLSCEVVEGAHVCQASGPGPHTVDLPATQLASPDRVSVTMLLNGGALDIDALPNIFEWEVEGINGLVSSQTLSNELPALVSPGEYRVRFGPLRGRLTVMREGSVAIQVPLAQVALDVQRRAPDEQVYLHAGYARIRVEIADESFFVPAPMDLGVVATTDVSARPSFAYFIALEEGELATLPVGVIRDESFMVSGQVRAPDSPDLSQGTLRFLKSRSTVQVDVPVLADGSYSVELEAGVYDVAAQMGGSNDRGLHVLRNLSVVEDMTQDFDVERFEVEVRIEDGVGELYAGIDWVPDELPIGDGRTNATSSSWASVMWGSSSAAPTFELRMRGDGETTPHAMTVDVHPAEEPSLTIERAMIARTFELRVDGGPPPTVTGNWRGSFSSAEVNGGSSIIRGADPLVVTVAAWADEPWVTYTPPQELEPMVDLPFNGFAPARVDLSADTDLVELIIHEVNFRIVDEGGTPVTLPAGATLSFSNAGYSTFHDSLPTDGVLFWGGVHNVAWECRGCGGAIQANRTSLGL